MDISNIVCVGVRRDIVLSLLNGPLAPSEMQAGSNSANRIHSINPLIKAGLVQKDRGRYHLTNSGKVMALIAKSILDAEIVMSDPFWQEHDLASVPDHLLSKIGMLKGGEVVRPNGDIMKAQRNFVDLVSSAKHIYGASSFNAPGYEDMITHALDNGAIVNLILTPGTFETISDSVLSSWVASGRCTITKKDGNFALTVADNTLSLGLFGLDGKYDPYQDFVCHSEDAAIWGRDLFNFYLHH